MPAPRTHRPDAPQEIAVDPHTIAAWLADVEDDAPELDDLPLVPAWQLARTRTVEVVYLIAGHPHVRYESRIVTGRPS